MRPASKDRKGYYYYYHCSSASGCRYTAEEVNKVFEDQLKQFIISPRTCGAVYKGYN